MDLGAAPSTHEVNLAIQLDATRQIIKNLERDNKDLKALVSAKNSSIIKLETENGRLKMTRSDKELVTQVEGLRKEVGLKDRALIDYKRQLDIFLENEKIILRRAANAEQKVVTVQETLVRMQRSRDAAHVEVEKHDRDRLEAVRTMIDASDRAKKAEARVVELEKKPIAKQVPKQDPKK
jgi:hypothetical protein